METKQTSNGTNNRIGILSFPKGIQRFPDFTGFEVEAFAGGGTENLDDNVDAATKELLTKYGGHAIDDKGNVLNDKGEILKSKEDIDKDSTEGKGGNEGKDSSNNQNNPATPEGGSNQTTDNADTTDTEAVDAFIDADGNLVDGQGIIFTKEQLETEKRLNEKGDLINPTTGEIIATAEQLKEAAANPGEEENLVAIAMQKENLVFNDETGNPKVYTNDLNGLSDYYNDVAIHKAREAQNEFLNVNPAIRDFARHILAGGTKESFYEKGLDTDYLTKEFKDLTPEEVDKSVLTFYKKKGFTTTMAETTIKTMKDADTYKTFSEDAFKELVNINKQEATDELKKIDDARQKEADDNAAYWNNVQQVVTTGTLSTMTIPETERNLFWDYLTKPVDKQGRSQELIDRAARDLNTDIQLAYLQFKKWDVKSLVNAELGRTRVQKIRETVARETSKNTTGKNSQNTSIRHQTGTPQITELAVEHFIPQNNNN